MGTKLHELRNGCFARAMDDEPMFVLLARDASAPDKVRQWAMKRSDDVAAGRKPATDLAVVEEALQTAEQMEAWRAQNDGAWREGLFARAEQLKANVAEGMQRERLTGKTDSPYTSPGGNRVLSLNGTVELTSEEDRRMLDRDDR